MIAILFIFMKIHGKSENIVILFLLKLFYVFYSPLGILNKTLEEQVKIESNDELSVR